MATVKKLKVEYEADIKQLQSKLKRLEGELKTSNAAVKKTSNQFAGMWKQMLGGQAAFALISRGFRAINRLMKDSIKAYGEQEKVERLLQTALQQTGKYSQAAFNDLKAYASEIQNLTTVGDETSLKLMQLGLSMGVSTDKIKEATKASIGLSKAYDLDLKSAMKMVALAYEGDFNMLQRYMPELKKLKDNTEKQAVAFKRFAEGWGIATEEAKTTEGQITQFNNTLGDMKEKVGKALTEALLPAFKDLKKTISDPSFQEGLSAMVGAFAKVLEYSAKLALSIPTFIGLLVEINEIAGKSADSATRNAVNQANAFYQMRDRLIEYGASYNELVKAMDDYQFAADGTRRTEMERLLAVRKNRAEFPKLIKAFEAYEKAMRSGKITTSDFANAADKVTEVIAGGGGAGGSGTTKAVEEFKFEMEDTSDQFKEFDKDIKDFKNDVTDLNEIIVDSGTVTKDWGKAIADTSQDINQIGQELLDLGESMGLDTGKFGSALSNLTSGIASFASGDIVGGIASAIGLIGDLFELFAAEDPIEAAMEDWNELIEAGKEGTKEMWDFMKQMKLEGIELDEMAEFVTEKINEGIAALGNYYDFAATSQERFYRAQTYTLAMFAGLMAQGMSFIDAIYEMGDAFTELLGIVEATGYEVNEALDFMLGLTDFIAQNEVLAGAIGAVGDILDSVFESGIYNIQQLQSIIHTVGADLNDMFNEVIAAGGTQEQAWAMIIPTLNDLIYYANQYGLTIDENTQKLIDEAIASGYLSEIQVPPMEKMVELMEIMVEMWSQFLGITYELSYAIDAVTTSTEKLGNAIENIGDDTGIEIVPPVITAAKGFHGILGQDTTIKAHQGEMVSITPKDKVGSVTNNNSRGDVNYNWSFPMTQGGNMSDNELENRLIGLVKRRGQLVDVMNQELD